MMRRIDGKGITGRAARTWLVVAAVSLFFFLALDSLVDDSPTMDEQNHIARGLAFLRTGDPRLSLEHPPLLNSISALPLLSMPELRLPTDHPSWERREGWYEFADLFLWQYNHDTDRIVFLSRLPIVFLTIALGLVGYRFAFHFWGRAAAVPALVLLLSEPNLMAHGRYATTDLGATLFTFLTTFLLWRLWQDSSRSQGRRWLLAAVAMGLAFGSKLSTLGFVPIWVVLALLPLYPDAAGGYGRAAVRRLGQLIAAGIPALLIVWLIFGLEWQAFAFISPALEPFNRWAGPMPTFWAGIEQIALLGQGGRSPAFLFGRFAEEGWLLYFPIAFAVKTPVVIILLLFVAASLLLARSATRRRAIFLLVAVVAFYLLAMQSALNIGYRHVLPALPYLLLLIAGLAAPEVRAVRVGRLSPRGMLAAGVAILVAIAIWIHPHYLSFFNAIAGGPSNGYRVLTDSNVDWGQDLVRLKGWMEDNGINEVMLGWFGTADPDYYAIAHQPLPGLGRDRFFRLWWEVPFDPVAPAPGVYAISASSLWEPPLRVAEKNVYAWFRAREPDDRIGYSILIYDVR